MSDGEELFDHQVTALTAGDLRKALEGVPDDMRIRVMVAEEPGGDTAAEQVVIAASRFGLHFEVSTEFPSGQYYRRKRDY